MAEESSTSLSPENLEQSAVTADLTAISDSPLFSHFDSEADAAAAHAVRPEDKTIISKSPPLSDAAGVHAPLPFVLGSTLVGQQLEHYVLTEFVGGGGMGAVFRATDTRLGRIVAVKVLSRDHTDEETIRRFKNEAQSAARLDHPNIARVYYVGEDRGWNFIVFEFIEGINLRDEVDGEGPLDLEQALHYTLQVAEALAHSSSRDVVHRDIKPSNVLVTAAGQIKLVDMGLARLHQVESSANDLTASGVTLGTFDYISPEQARDPRAADVRSDIYSLGCTLFFMLTGQPPFPDGTALQKLLRHNSDEPPDVRSFRPELHPRVAGLLTKMLSKRPAQRQQSAAELMADIVGLGQHLGLTSVAEFGHVLVVPVPGVHWKNVAWQMALAVALLVASLFAVEALLLPRQAGGNAYFRPQFRHNDVQEPDTTVSQVDTTAILNERPPLDTTPADITESNTSLPITSFPARASASDPSGLIQSTAPPGEPAHTAPQTDTVGALPLSSPAQVTVPAVEENIRHVVVAADKPASPEPQTEYLNSLAEAVDRAAEHGLSEVELRYSGPRIEQPLEIAHPRLTIRAAIGFEPTIVFQPRVRGDRQMIRLAGGSSAHLALDGVGLRLDLPSESPADGWSLLAMSTGQSLELTECVLTVLDGDGAQPPIHDHVAMVAVQRRRLSEGMTMGDPQLAMGQQARVTLERSIVRGEASLITMTDETPLTVRWNQGLLVTSRHLIETGGSASEPQYYEQIVLDLDNVTAYCREGLFYLRRGSGKAYQFHIDAYADQCIFMTEVGVPLFEMIGLAGPPEDDQLRSTGEGNRFSPIDMPFLFVRPSAGSEPERFKLGRRWSSEARPQAGVPWVRPPPTERPAHALTKHDFETDSDPAINSAGFDLLLLPEIAPAIDRSPPAPSSAPEPIGAFPSLP